MKHTLDVILCRLTSCLKLSLRDGATESRVGCTINRSRTLAEVLTPHLTRTPALHTFTATMDVEMGDVAYDIDIDVGAGVQTSAQPQQQVGCAARDAVLY